MPGLSDVETAVAYLGLGGNLADPVANMAAALRALDADAKIAVTAVSCLYRTPPWGVTDQPDFVNAAAMVETSLSPRKLLARCLEVERLLKRERRERWGPRLIDIDVLNYEDVELMEDGLVLPHPRMHERAFVLVPLADIAPKLQIAGRTVRAWMEKTNTSDIKRLGEDRDWWR
ncbi:2-amino-4-hydroxy-6-hydroxymethyldihydropteridine diphosphokinase [Nitratireductor basaltis]|uniref:2-amino-4-hydroxy-6-hydroxymethyldihydropteridine pyrophosphokinase n=1 Tax=Nitratireductor basaltis TaxID=472175 RepID=A0A084UB11_9HYPH|nr:2-amino-4-hydroxy-6-hydroxymethyldihydropteridine diphosphokinase [Nitratireductor basaltis]KFB10147.1 2-amino-4-hydroxy-6-hydroxymethyldihydropteridine pyrophosphokinase [Nitratireductor basaltis]